MNISYRLLVLLLMFFCSLSRVGAQTVRDGGAATPSKNGSTVEKPPARCGGLWDPPGAECSFQCQAGDYIYARSITSGFRVGAASVTAYCDDEAAAEVRISEFDWGVHDSQSEAPMKRMGVGRCVVRGLKSGGGLYFCSSGPLPD